MKKKKNNNKNKNKVEKRDILKYLPELMKQDEDFRLKLIGILIEYLPSRQEYSEILKRLDEHTKILDEHTKILSEHTKILSEHTKILDEHTKTLEGILKKQEEHSRVLEEHSKVIREHSEILAKLVQKVDNLDRKVDSLDRTVGRIGQRYGIMAEDMFRRATDAILKKLFGEKYQASKTKVNGKDLDILISDGKEVAVEVSTSLNIEQAKKVSERMDTVRRSRGQIPAYVVTASASADAVLFLKEKDIRVITPEPEE